MAILATAYKVWNLSKMFYLVNINLESTSKISLERNLNINVHIVFVKTREKCRIIFISPSQPPEWRGVGGDPPAPAPVSAVWSERDKLQE